MPTLRKPGLALAASARQAFTKGGEVAAEISTPSLSRPASFSMRAREAASTIGTLRPPLASRRPETRNIWPWKSAISPASSARQIFTVSPIADQRPGRLQARRLEIGRRAGAEAEDDAAGIHLVERRRRHGDEHRMHRIGAHRHQRDLDAPGGAQRQRRHGDGIAQIKVAGDPQGRGAALLRRLGLGRDVGDRRAAVHGDAELSHAQSRKRS